MSQPKMSGDPAVALFKFLKTCTVPKGERATFTKMEGGKVYVPADKREKFLDLWCAALPQLPPAFNLVPQMQQRKSIFVIDLDVFTKTKTILPLHKLVSFTKIVLSIVDNENGREYIALICSKDEPYQKTKGGVSGWKTGAHIYIANRAESKPKYYSRKFMTNVRNYCYNEIADGATIMADFCQGLDLLEPTTEVWDEAVARKDTFPMMLGSEKPTMNTGGAPKPRWMGRFSGEAWTHETEAAALLESMKNFKDRRALLGLLYDCIWTGAQDTSRVATETRPAGPVSVAPEQPTIEFQGPAFTEFRDPSQDMTEDEEHRSEPIDHLLVNRDGFQLDYFLEISGHVKPSHSEGWYIRIITYMATMGLDAKETGDLTQKHWNKSNPHETETYIRKFQSTPIDWERAPNKEAIMDWLDINDIDFLVRSLFKPAKSYFTQKEYRKFAKKRGRKQKAFDIEEVKTFIADVFSFVQSDKVFVSKKEEVFTKVMQDGRVHKEKNQGWDIGQDMPFSGTEDFNVLVNPTKKDYIKRLRKMIPSKITDKNRDIAGRLAKALVACSACTTGAECTPHAAKVDLVLTPALMPICAIFGSMQRDHEIERYQRMEFLPYNKRWIKDPCHEDCFNTWQGFPLNDYKPTKQVDYQKTALYQLLCRGWANNDPEVADYLLNCIAWKARFPFLKTQRANYLRSLAQGTGKTTFFQFLTKLFGKKSVLFLLDLGRMHCRFNAWQVGALYICIDDLKSATKKQIEKCKSRITSERYPYEIKNGKTMTLNNYEEYWMTSNAIKDVFVEPGDRRGVFLTCSEVFVQDRKFFAKIYNELEDQDVMHAWWLAINNRKFGDFDPRNAEFDPAVCTAEKTAAKFDCAKQCHNFIAEFFTNQDWPLLFKSFHDDRLAWLANYDIQKLAGPSPKQNGDGHWPVGTIRIVIKSRQFYKLYKAWMKENCPGRGSQPRQLKTFWAEVAELNITQRKGITFWNKAKSNSNIVLYAQEVAEGFQKLYGSVPNELSCWGIVTGTWKDTLKVITDCECMMV